MMPEDRSHSTTNSARRAWLLPIAILAGGVLAWGLAVTVVLLAADEPLLPDDATAPVEVAAGRPTLAALTSTPTETPTATATPSPSPTATRTPTPEPPPAPLESETPPVPDSVPVSGEGTAPGEPVLSNEATAVPGESGACSPPDGWEPYTVQQDDTLFAFVLGAGGTVTVDDLVAANCLNSRYLQVGQLLYLPPGAAENAPPSVPEAAAGPDGARGPRTPNCPCTIVIPPGWRLEQIAGAIDASSTLFTGADFLAAVGPGVQTSYDFTQERPPGTSLEGFMYPGTYTVQNDTTAEAFRDMLLEAFAANVSPTVRADAAAKGVTFYQALILASVVQRESRVLETQKLIASIYFNRLRDGNRLASTVPVSYALGRPGNWWPRVTGSNMEVDSPYNTYTRPGLPPTPINSPDINAIIATVYAPETDLYYHSGGCGRGAAFARTYEEHLANIRCE